jgi:hypothetical protein
LLAAVSAFTGTPAASSAWQRAAVRVSCHEIAGATAAGRRLPRPRSARGDAESAHALAGDVAQHGCQDLERAAHQRLRVVLDLAGRGTGGEQLAVRLRARRAALVEQQGPHAGRPLVEGHDERGRPPLTHRLRF